MEILDNRASIVQEVCETGGFRNFRQLTHTAKLLGYTAGNTEVVGLSSHRKGKNKHTEGECHIH